MAAPLRLVTDKVMSGIDNTTFALVPEPEEAALFLALKTIELDCLKAEISASLAIRRENAIKAAHKRRGHRQPHVSLFEQACEWLEAESKPLDADMVLKLYRDINRIHSLADPVGVVITVIDGSITTKDRSGKEVTWSRKDIHKQLNRYRGRKF